MNLRKPYITIAHVIIEIVSLVIIILTLLFSIYSIKNISGPIPTHYDFSGNVTGYGSPKTLIVMPLIMLGCNLLVAAAVHLFPKKYWNMPVKVKPHTSNRVYKDTVWMMVLIELEISIYTAIFTAITCRGSAHGIFAASMVWVAVLFITIGVIWAMMVKHNRG